MLKIFSLVFSQICIGGLALLPLVPAKEIGEGFFKFMGGLYLVIMVLVLGAGLTSADYINSFGDLYSSWGGWELVLGFAFTALLAVYNLTLWFRLSSLQGGLLVAATILGGGAVIASSMNHLTPSVLFGRD